MATFLLFESASGFALFEHTTSEEIGMMTEQMQVSTMDFGRFSKIVKFAAFLPFTSAENALAAINEVSEGVVSADLKNFLEANLPTSKKGKKSDVTLGVCDPQLRGAIQDLLDITCKSDDKISELLRGIRTHFVSYIKDLREGDLEKAQLGLAHSYSRSAVKFNVHKADNMIIQCICLLDQLDKDVNTLSMRAKEWYSWHFPELSKIVTDSYTYAKLVGVLKRKESVTEEMTADIEQVVDDPEVAKAVVHAAKHSMGQEISDVDLLSIESFAVRVVRLSEYRKKLSDYLQQRMAVVAPNLTTLVGDTVGARLISHAGSLTNLAKYPASTVQILGAEKALFRALKTKGNTPKYGLIFHSSFIGRAGAKNKGRISRYLANKCSIAARIDCFSDESSDAFGLKLRDQVEDRLKFYETGEVPKKNIDVMLEAIANANKGGGAAAGSAKKKKSKDKDEEVKEEKKKRKTPESDDGDDGEKKKKKKDKKEKTKEKQHDEDDGEKKKKKKKNKD